MVDLKTELSTISLIDEVYDFKNKAGEITFQHRCSSLVEPCFIEYAKYFNDQTVYLSTNNTSKCEKRTIGDKEVLEKFMLRWLPKDIYIDGETVAYNQLLGPSSMLLHLK